MSYREKLNESMNSPTLSKKYITPCKNVNDKSENKTNGKDVISCDSHVFPVFRGKDIEDDTPILHRTHDSVMNSYSALNLKHMTDGSYSDSVGLSVFQ